VSTPNTPAQVRRHHRRRRSRGWTTRAHRRTATPRRTRQVCHVNPFRVAHSVSSRCTPTPSHERPRFCLRTCTLHPCDAGSPDAKPSRPAAHTNGTGPPLQPEEVASQTGSPLPTVAAGDTACRYERWSVTSARRPLRRAMLWWRVSRLGRVLLRIVSQ
jgi:hypothetical protein